MYNFTITLDKKTEENKTLIWQNAIYLDVFQCTFSKCHIIINNIANIDLEYNNFIDCTFDLDLSATVGKVHINDNFISYPGNLQALEECRSKVVPVSGDFYAYKFLHDEFSGKRYIAKLLIPAEARRSSAGSEKCRAEKALVINIWEININWNTDYTFGSGKYPITCDIIPTNIVHHGCLNASGKNIIYKVKEYVTADAWDENRFAECTNGIHFYLNLKTVITNFFCSEEDLIEDIIRKIGE